MNDIGKVIKRLDTVDSTNDVAKRWIKEGACHGSIVVADEQTGGRGRLGRSWGSPKGEGIWMSVILKPKLAMEDIPNITLLAGLCMCNTLRAATGLDIGIKWPNDLVVNGKKVCGILAETAKDLEGNLSVVIGIGVNVNMLQIPDMLPYATSLAIESGKLYNNDDIIDLFAKQMQASYTRYETGQAFEVFLSDYRQRCLNIGKQAKIITQDGHEEIVYVEAILATGALVVKSEEGKKQNIVAGEVSVRGIYGYI